MTTFQKWCFVRRLKGSQVDEQEKFCIFKTWSFGNTPPCTLNSHWDHTSFPHINLQVYFTSYVGGGSFLATPTIFVCNNFWRFSIFSKAFCISWSGLKFKGILKFVFTMIVLYGKRPQWNHCAFFTIRWV